jgi:hypothetical protein
MSNPLGVAAVEVETPPHMAKQFLDSKERFLEVKLSCGLGKLLPGLERSCRC